MTVTLELSTEELAVLREVAGAAGVEIESVLHGLIAQILPAEETRQPVKAEEEAESAAEEAERRREQEEVQANIRRWRSEARTE